MELKITKLGIGIWMSLLLLSSCYYDIEEELYPSRPCNQENMSYASDILPLMQVQGCLACHGDLATLDLQGYTDLKVSVDNGNLLGSIEHHNGFRPMPENSPKMKECDIEKIKSWINAGAPNN